ncbi:MAG: hypothetical protein COX57_06950 [Alphaproteobacteria bacterium CG_4_10_14_0_2_um_filter_63_37]|nr:MAG: hypothetical protein AUJ55_06900 [Proteobacteria bacterium CG1_02_64_396]PJA24733.1 MAG: hypothetical protein COX57_06950 [Alphaproteobacteria bacterium CG_4_10_14_0_2_um_filter_63_37]
MRGDSGFTLFDLLVAVAILGLLTAISVPAVTNILEISRLKAAARFIKGDMMNQRMVCVKERHDIVFYFNNQAFSVGGVGYQSNTINYVVWSDENRDGVKDAGELSQRSLGYNLIGGQVINRFPGITISADVDSITFDSRGSAEEGIITLTDPSGRQRQVEVSIAGMVKVD